MSWFAVTCAWSDNAGKQTLTGREAFVLDADNANDALDAAAELRPDLFERHEGVTRQTAVLSATVVEEPVVRHPYAELKAWAERASSSSKETDR